ncbi:hypothetical protein ACX0G9_07980 [Flavitalea flava]
MDYYFTLIFIVIAFLASITIYFQGKAPGYLTYFPVFLFINVIVESTSVYLLSHGKFNIFLLNPFTILSVCFYLFTLRGIIHKVRVKKILLFLILAYPVVAFFNILFLQKGAVFHSMSYSFGCLLIVAFSIYYFFELFQLTHTVNLLRQPAFWICTGLLLYFICSFPLYGLNSSLALITSPSLLKNLMILFNLLDVFLYSSFTIAFLCRLRIRKST